MNEMEFLIWVRGPGLAISLGVFILSVIWRLIETYGLGRKKDLTVPRQGERASGWYTIFRRFLPPPGAGMMKVARVTYIGGITFHVGLAMVVFLFEPHIKLLESVTGLSWPGLPSQIIDLAAGITMAAMVVVLFDRLTHRVKKFLSTFEDYFTWTITFLPVITGYLTVQHLFISYTKLLALHILTVEILLICLPYTKLIHTFTAFGSRWFNGDTNGHKGVPV